MWAAITLAASSAAAALESLSAARDMSMRYAHTAGGLSTACETVIHWPSAVLGALLAGGVALIVHAIPRSPARPIPEREWRRDPDAVLTVAGRAEPLPDVEREWYERVFGRWEEADES